MEPKPEIKGEKESIIDKLPYIIRWQVKRKLKKSQEQLVRRSDGNIMRSKDQIKYNYDNSWIPVPFRGLFALDYCWNITKKLAIHSIVLTCPISLIYIVWKRPGILKSKWRAMPYGYMARVYFIIWLSINLANDASLLLMEDYWYSDIYEGRRSSKELSHQLKEQKNIHNQTVKGKIGKGFTDQELGIDVEKLDKLITNSKYE